MNLRACYGLFLPLCAGHTRIPKRETVYRGSMTEEGWS
jgi:hypothetical protein